MNFALTFAVAGLVFTPHQKREAIARREDGDPLMEIACRYSVAHDQ